MKPTSKAILISALYGASVVGPGWAGTCTVPGSHASLSEAVVDPVCAVIQAGAQAFDESISIRRDLTLAGPMGGGAELRGRLQLASGASVQISDFEVTNDCEVVVDVRQAAELDAVGLLATRDPAPGCPPIPIFSDGFETGDTGEWSTTSP